MDGFISYIGGMQLTAEAGGVQLTPRQSKRGASLGRKGPAGGRLWKPRDRTAGDGLERIPPQGMHGISLKWAQNGPHRAQNALGVANSPTGNSPTGAKGPENGNCGPHAGAANCLTGDSSPKSEGQLNTGFCWT